MQEVCIGMKAYLTDFFKVFTYPEEAQEQLFSAYDKIVLNKELRKEFDILLNTYAADKDCNFGDLLARMSEISHKAGVHEYVGALLLSVCLTKHSKKHYEAEGISEQIWFTTMCDLKWKMLECKDVYDIWGTFVAGWLAGFFNVTRFGLGRLQFELIPFNADYTKDGVTLTPESTVINVHIPRTGTRLERPRSSFKKDISWSRLHLCVTHGCYIPATRKCFQPSLICILSFLILIL